MFTPEELAQIEINSAKLRAIVDPIYATWSEILAPLTQEKLLKFFHELPISEHSNAWESV